MKSGTSRAVVTPEAAARCVGGAPVEGYGVDIAAGPFSAGGTVWVLVGFWLGRRFLRRFLAPFFRDRGWEDDCEAGSALSAKPTTTASGAGLSLTAPSAASVELGMAPFDFLDCLDSMGLRATPEVSHYWS
ncbi:hypothetical protein V5799_010649 [Amblyomma americanum]|uniref:Uncharacterized protein n=1 Tax=Amblyomma americanum TaxID=6943 RepID=A0AAQ4EJM4_AMBAM